MRILILGSEGFIGSHCVEYFQALNHKVHGADLFDQPSQRYVYNKISRLSPALDELLNEFPFDVIINAAGSSNVPYSMAHPVLDFEANCLDTILLLEGIKKYQTDAKYIHLSSAAVYGNPQSLPISEQDSIAPLSPYGWHKWMAENICKEYSQLYQLKTAILRPFSVYGPGLKKQLFWDLYQKLRMSNGHAVLHGNGAESRDYVYIKDLIHAINTILLHAPMDAEIYNVASGLEITIDKATHTFLKLLGLDSSYSFNGIVRKGDPLNWRADISKIKSIGFKPNYSFEQGLSGLCEWVKKLD